ncbi:glucosyl-3-phosphoglycerate synthase [Corynebacterium flavescens]
MRVSVVIPALNEEATVAEVVRSCLADDPEEVIVIDADSTDSTARRAQEAGARVINWRDALPDPPRPGKGESLWRGVAAARGEVIVFIDADLESARPGMVSALARPFSSPDIHMVKARYRRSLDGQPHGGGRVTELTAKPLLRQFFPELAHINQPLGGEYALRASSARQLPFVAGYGVEAGLLIDVGQRHGTSAIAEVDLGLRVHRNRPLVELAPMADVVAATILTRAGVAKQGVEQRPALEDRI